MADVATPISDLNSHTSTVLLPRSMLVARFIASLSFRQIEVVPGRQMTGHGNCIEPVNWHDSTPTP